MNAADFHQDSADLCILTIEAEDTACKSQNIFVNTTISNIGSLEAKHFSLHYFLSEKLGVTPSDMEIGSHLIENLSPQENLTLNDMLIIPPNMGFKLYTLGVIVDPAHDIYEENTRNNDKVLNHQIQIKDC